MECINIGDKVYVESGGKGCFCANGITGIIVDRKEAILSKRYNGEFRSGYAIYYVKSGKDYFGLCKGCVIKKL